MKRAVIFALMVLCLAFPASVQPAELSTQKVVLDNGLTVLITELPSTSVMALYGYVKTGSATEFPYLGSGLSHFLEHMLFKGTKKRAVGSIAQEVKSMGGNINASTSFDYTLYHIELPAGIEAFTQALDILADMLMNATLDPKEVELEREVIINEMRMVNDRPERQLGNLVFETVFQHHPYQHPIIGYPALFKAASREHLVDYYQTHYIPNNIIFSVAGPLKAEEVLPLIKTAFEKFPAKPYQLRNLPQEPAQIAPRYADKEYTTDLIRMTLAWQSVDLLNEDLYALDVLAMALGRGETSRLYTELFKKQGLVESISAYNYTPQDTGVFGIDVVFAKDNVQATIAEVKRLIEIIKAEGVSKAELEKTKRQVLSAYVFDNQTAPSIAHRTAMDEAMTGDYDFGRKYTEQLAKVTNEDIKRVARKYLVDSNRSTVILWPKGQKPDAADLVDQAADNEIQKYIFKNGLTVLLKEDHSFPLIAIHAAVNAGTRYEDPSLTGLSQLTSQMWTKGTKKQTAEEIAESVESRGAGLGEFSGRNSMGLTLHALKEDTDFALGLLADLVKNPVFPEKELIKEKSKLLTAIAGREDSVVALSFMHLTELLFQSHPLRYDPLGSAETVNRITRDDIVRFYGQLVTGPNMVISVFGDIDSGEVLRKLQTEFEGSLTAQTLEKKEFHEDPPEEVRRKIIHKDKEQAAILYGFHGPDMFDPDRFGLEVIASVLGSSLSGRLFVKVREELGQAYTLGSSLIPSIDMGMVFIYVLTPAESVERVQAIVNEELRLIAKEGVTPDELAKAKADLKGGFLMGLDTIGALGFTTTLDELYGLGFNHYKKYDEAVDAVTGEDIKRLTAQYLNPDRAAIVIMRAEEKN